jgi:hypothetical protein
MGPSRFTSHPKEGVLRIFIALKNPSPWPGFEPATFVPSGKHTNHCANEATNLVSKSFRGNVQTEFGFIIQIHLFPVYSLTCNILAPTCKFLRKHFVCSETLMAVPLRAKSSDRLLVCPEPIRHICLTVIGCRCR